MSQTELLSKVQTEGAATLAAGAWQNEPPTSTDRPKPKADSKADDDSPKPPSPSDSDDAVSCRVCLVGPPTSDLIQPCRCKGSIRWIHRSCLDADRARSDDAFVRCGICTFVYELRPANDVTEDRRLIRFRCLLLRDGLVGLVGLYLSIFVLACLSAGIAAVVGADNQRLTDWTGETVLASYHLLAVAELLLIVSIVGLFHAANRPSAGHNAGGGGCGSGCGSIDCCPGGGGGGELAIIIFFLIVLAVLAFGLFVGLGAGIHYVGQRIQNHTERIWRGENARLRIVVDRAGPNDLRQQQQQIAIRIDQPIPPASVLPSFCDS